MSISHFTSYVPSDADLAEMREWEASRMARYRAELHAMDWSFEQSDDVRVVREHRERLTMLRAMRPQIDPDGSVWASIAPNVFGAPSP